MHSAFGEVLGRSGAGRTGQGGGEARVGIAVVEVPATSVVIGNRRTDREACQHLVESVDSVDFGGGIDDPRPLMEEGLHVTQVGAGGATLGWHP